MRFILVCEFDIGTERLKNAAVEIQIYRSTWECAIKIFGGKDGPAVKLLIATLKNSAGVLGAAALLMS